MPPSHATAYELLAPTYVLDLPRAGGDRSTDVDPALRLDVEAVFGRVAPLVVEVGSGSGDAAVAGARARPDWDVLAFEVWRPGVGQALARLAADPPGNLRFAEVDASTALLSLLGPGAVHELWTYFPDPWPKGRHHKRAAGDPRLRRHGVQGAAARGTVARGHRLAGVCRGRAAGRRC